MKSLIEYKDEKYEVKENLAPAISVRLSISFIEDEKYMPKKMKISEDEFGMTTFPKLKLKK